MRRLAALVLTLGLSLSAAPGEARTPETAYARQAFAATNAQRADEGLEPLRKSRCLQRFARAQATLMAQREALSHQQLGPIIKRCKVQGAGENVAYGYPNGASVVDDGWMDSAGHRANILDPAYRLMAIAARRGHDGNWYIAQVFGAR